MTSIFKHSEASRVDSDRRVQTDFVLLEGRGTVIRVTAPVRA